MKNFGDLFGESLREYGSKFMAFLITFLLLYLVPAFLFGSLMIVFLVFFLGLSFNEFMIIISGNMDFAKTVLEGFVFSGAALVFLLGFLASLVLFGIFLFLNSLVMVYIGVSDKKKITFREAFKGSQKYFWKFLGLSVVLFVSLFFLFMLLVVPGVIFLVFWIFSSIVLFRENLGIRASMKQSRRVVSGRWWKVFGYGLLFMLIVGIVSWIFSAVALGDFVQGLVLTPLGIIFLKNFYLELKKTKSEVKSRVKARGKKKVSRKKK